jgi:membrane-associated phospholipid phosphatase
VSSSARARWLVILLIIIVDGIGLVHFGMHLSLAGLSSGAGALIVFATLAAFYTYKRPDDRIVDVAHSAAQLIAVFAVSGAFSYLITATALPLIDEKLSAVDGALGFDWLRWFTWVNHHKLLNLILVAAYASAMPQLVIITCYLALSGQPERTREVIWTVMLSLLVIVPLSGLLPAESAWVYYGVTSLVDAVHMPDFTALRDGRLLVLDLRHLEGLITFPSFHATLAVLFIYVTRGRRIPLVIAAVINAVMLVSVLTVGGHYLIDVVAGVAVAAAAIWATAQIEAQLKQRYPTAAASAAE